MAGNRGKRPYCAAAAIMFLSITETYVTKLHRYATIKTAFFFVLLFRTAWPQYQ